MKKVLVLILAVLVCTCSTNDDDSQVINIDPIIGIWQPDYEVTVFTNGNQDSKMSSPCELNNRITFGNDGNFFMTNYPESIDPNCEELVGNLYQSGTWTQLSETNYLIILKCMIPDCDSIEERPDEISFPNSNTMRIKEFDDDENISYMYYYYNRIQ